MGNSPVENSIVRCAIALGSNMGTRLTNLERAFKLWKKSPHVKVIESSHVYESPPEGNNLQGNFYNAVFTCDTSLGPEELLRLSHRIESQCGRNREEEKKSGICNRTVDCDIIFYGDIEIRNDLLTIPHESWSIRPFVCLPLSDVYNSLTQWQKNLVKKVTKGDIRGTEACRRLKNVLN